jgi:hypothetical protein
MAPYDENGFLGEKIIDWIQAHRENHKSVLALTQQLNREQKNRDRFIITAHLKLATILERVFWKP